MKLRSFGKLFSLVAVLALVFALTCAMAVTAGAESIDALAAEGDMTITVTAPHKECGKVKLSWDKVNGAYAYAVYCNEEHLANSVVTYYSVGSLEVAAHGDEEIVYSFKVVAIDANGNEIAFGAVEAPAKHNYIDVVTEPTCTEGGYTTHTCACGDEYVDAYVDALGHDYGEWIEIVEPLCEVDGVLGHYTCSRCSLDFDAELELLESLVIPAIGHSFTNYVYNEDATCLLDGTKTALCDNECGTTNTLTAENTALGHSFTNHVYNGDATCTLDGTKTALCDNGCGESETLTAENTALGHSFTNYVFNDDATCTTDGSSTAVCDNGCGETDTLGTPGTATGHYNADPIVENYVAPDCVNNGRYDSVVYCSECLVEISRETVTVDALGHTPDDVVVENNVPATCTANGSYDNVVYCFVCNAEISRETVTVDALGHTGGAATCTLPANCERCGEPYGEPVGHIEAEVVVENNVLPDCVNPGSYDNVVYCAVCGEELSRENITVDALGHTPLEAVKENDVQPDCLNSGSYDNVVYCSECNEELSRENITVDALGHNFANYKSDKNATCLEDGTKTAKCSRCDAKDTKRDAGSLLGHKFTEYTPDGNATCFEDGTKTAKCDNKCGTTDTLLDEGSMLAHELELERNPDAFVLYRYCMHCGGEKEFGKVQIPVPYRMTVLKASVVLVCLIIVLCSIKALTRPATTTPWWKRGRY